MTNLFLSLIAHYGFFTVNNGVCFGCGSICNGMRIAIVRCGDSCCVTTTVYTMDGDTTTTMVVPLAMVWQALPEQVFACV